MYNINITGDKKKKNVQIAQKVYFGKNSQNNKEFLFVQKFFLEKPEKKQRMTYFVKEEKI